MKLKNYKIGQKFTMPMVVLKAIERETKNKKPYLHLELFDGLDKISGNYWDWPGTAIPEKNTIVDITAQLTEYIGLPQLNIKAMHKNVSEHISSFTPTGGSDIGQVYMEAYSLMSDISDNFLRELSLKILEELKHLWITAPAANSIHHAYTAGTLVHSLSVARVAKAIASVTEGAFIELATVGGFLHDVGKLFGYQINGIICEMTDEGMLFEHTFLGARFISNFAEDLIKSFNDEAKLDLLIHIVLSHHGKREFGAAVPPATIEAHIVHHADCLDATTEQIRVESNKTPKSKWTERIWALENRPHINPKFISAALEKTEE